MSQRILKYLLHNQEFEVILMPNAAKILTVQIQRNIPVLWALVDTREEPRERVIELILTGEFVVHDAYRKYISTTQDDDGIVCHWFEKILNG